MESVPTSIDVSVVIPVYNNSATLEALTDRLVAVLEKLQVPFEVIYVDDGSRDESLAMLQARAARDARLRPFALVRNFGSQAAVCAGFDLVRGRRVVCMDADLENCPEDIPALLALLDQGHDLVCGYRQSRDSPLFSRRLPSAMMNAYVRNRTGTTIRDIGCGMRAFQSWVVRDLASEGEARRLLTPLFLRRASRIAEHRLTPGIGRRSGGHSFLSLLGIAVDYYMLTAKRPFLVAGLLAGTVAVAGAGAWIAGSAMAGAVLFCCGGLGVLVSLVGEYCQRLYQLAQGIPFYQLREAQQIHDPSATVQTRE
ncbi:MAG TPA: glycosyltransferase family 2 protein [Candidatus Binatia bacterium]|nr:glycosyltransferase family 2 protein [Candidatus Binatia bacterium]